MSRRFLKVAAVVLMVPHVSVAGGVQDSLRVGRDSVETQSQDLVYLSDEVETWQDLRSAGAVTSRFSWLWRLPETLEEVTGGLAPESARLTGLPLLRGLNAKRTAVTFDGVPLDHSGLREGPSLLPLGAMDPAFVGGLRVVKGPLAAGSSSDGIAGHIDIRSALSVPEDEGFAVPGTSVLVSQQLSSVDRGWSGGATVSGGDAAVRYRLGGAARLLGDVRAGTETTAGPARQPNTSLRESTFHGLVSYDLTTRWNVRVGGFGSWRDGQAVVDELDNRNEAPPADDVTVFDPRHFAFGYASSRLRDLGFIRQLESTLWFNAHRESRTFRRLEWERTVFDDDRLHAAGFRSEVQLKDIDDHSISVAFDVKLEGADAVRWEIRDDGSLWNQRGRFPVGSRSRVINLGVHHSWRVSSGMAISGDVRFSSRMNHAAYGPSVFGLTGLVGLVDRTYRGLSWRADVERTSQAGWHVSASAASGFRAPGLDDQVANAFWLHGRDVPNPELEPERATQLEVEAGYEAGAFSFGAALFRTSYKDLIGRDWFEPGPDGFAGTDDDLYTSVNHRSASTYGLEAEMTAGFDFVAGTEVALAGSVSLHRWSSSGVATPRYLPPVVGRAGSRFMKGAVWVEPYLRFTSRTQAPRYSTIGAVFDGTPGWVTANIRAGLRASDRLALAAAIENAGDVRYREHGSYLVSPGRNLVLSASYRF